jgi:hypothetical protein
MSISRRQFLLGTTAGLILPSFYERAYSFFENHGEPLLIAPNHAEGILCVTHSCDTLQLHLGDPEEGPPEMSIREFCLRHGHGDPATWYRDDWLCIDDPDPVDMNDPMDEWAIFDWWLRTDSSSARAYHFLENLDLGSHLTGPDAVGSLEFIDGPCPGNDYLGVEAFDELSVSLLQHRLNELGTGLRIEMR